MAFRIEKRIAGLRATALLIAFITCVSLQAQVLLVQVRHKHLHHGGEGELKFGEGSVAFVEKGKHQDHSREWKYGNIQQLMLKPDSLQIRTYDDVRWQLGRDREYDFDLIAKESIPAIYSLLKTRMDQRFVAAIAAPVAAPLWRADAKLLEGRGGSQGTVLVGEDQIVYHCEKSGEARSWGIKDIDNISSSGPFELTLTTFERSLSAYGNRRQFRFQLKQALPEARYQALWRRITYLKNHEEN